MGMQDGVCPECGSTEIYTRKGWFHNVVVAFIPPRTRIYVCGQCGYLAEFIIPSNPLKHIRKKWERVVTPMKRKNEDISDA